MTSKIFRDYENYKVYRDGNIYSYYIEDFLLPLINKDGYYIVTLYKENIPKGRRAGTIFLLHRIVAELFVDNPNKYKIVNHKDGIKINPHYTNLEWVTHGENNSHAIAFNLRKQRSTKVFHIINEVEYNSIKEASLETGVSENVITNNCKNRVKNPIWSYSDRSCFISEEEVITWKKIETLPNYKISKDGRVYSLKYKKLLSLKPKKSGYVKLSLYSGGRTINTSVHRLVAEAYIPNPENLPVVNHKDGNPQNNKVENLEWCTKKQNTQHALSTSLMKKKTMKIEKLDEDGNVLETYESAKIAALAHNRSKGAILAAINKQGKCAGWRFRYKNPETVTRRLTIKRKNSRKVYKIDKETGKIIDTYDSIANAARECGLKNETISSTVRGKQKTSGGFVWKYAN